MNDKISAQWVKSAAAVLCVGSICLSIASISGKLAEAMKSTAASSSVLSSSQESTGGDNLITDAAGEAVTEENGEIVTDESAQADGNSQQAAAGTEASAKPGSSTTAKSTNSAPSSKAEIINYCNTALNAVKSSKAGYTKKYVRKATGSTSGVPSIITNLITKDKTTTMAKGKDSTDDFPAAGFSWSSKLRESDVKDATIKTNGQYYEITLKLATEKNPAKGEASSYGRVMSVIDANDAKDMLSGIKSITMTYHDGYVYAKIDSKTKKLVTAEFSASADIAASISILGDIAVNGIVSTETYSNFKW